MQQFRIIAPIPFMGCGADFYGLELPIDGIAATALCKGNGKSLRIPYRTLPVPVGDLLEAFARKGWFDLMNQWAGRLPLNTIIFIPLDSLQAVPEEKWSIQR